MKSNAISLASFALISLLVAGTRQVQAKALDGTIEEQLLEIQKKLDELKQGQENIMTAMNQLSEEHKQIRYFAHKR
jgi:hypothetical protein